MVTVGLKKLNNRKIQVSISRLRDHRKFVQNYSSQQQVRRVLEKLDLGRDAADYYLLTLLPHLSETQQLNFPALDVSEKELVLLGFKSERSTEAPFSRSA